jgi:hypothetical protein
MSWGKFIGTVGLFGAYLTKNFLCGVRVRSAERKQKDLPVGRSFEYYNIFCFTSSAGFHDLFHHK